MTQPLKTASILIVEDSWDDYEATERSFRKAGWENPIHWCNCGKDALAFLKREGLSGGAQEPLPGLILLDLNMPGMDGRRLLQLIKQEPALAHIPVVILTTSANDTDVRNCYKLGASTYIQKPVHLEALQEAMKCIKDYWFETAILPRAC